LSVGYFNRDLVTGCHDLRRAHDLVTSPDDRVATLEGRARRECAQPPGCMLEAGAFALHSEGRCAPQMRVSLFESFTAALDHALRSSREPSARAAEALE
jgi:hypothetical protein